MPSGLENKMNDFMIATLFLIMVLAPCVVALRTGVHDLEEESDELDAHRTLAPTKA